MPKTEDMHTTVLAKSLKQNRMQYEVTDITKQTYELLLKKRVTAERYQEEFVAEGHQNWYEMLIGQTEYAMVPYEEFQQKMARYLYMVHK